MSASAVSSMRIVVMPVLTSPVLKTHRPPIPGTGRGQRNARPARKARRSSWPVGSPAEGLHSPREESDFGRIFGLVDRGLVGGCGLVGLAEATEEVGADRVEDVVALER